MQYCEMMSARCYALRMQTSKERIQDLLLCDFTQKEIAKEMGVAESTVNSIVKERIRQPGGDAAILLYLLHKKYAQRIRRKKAALRSAAAAQVPAGT